MRRRVAGLLSALLLWVLVWACVAWRTSYLPGASKVPSTFGMQSALARVLPALTFDAVGLSDVIDFMRDVSGSNIDVDWWALKRAGVEPDSAASASMRNVAFGEGLIGFLRPLKLTFYTGDGAIVISPEGDRPRQWTAQRASSRDGRSDLDGPYDAAMRLAIPNMQFDRAKLGEVLDFLSASQGFPVHVDWESLNEAGVRKDRSITFQGRNRSVSAVLSSILIACSDKDALQFQVRSDGVYVSTRAEFDRQETRTPWWRSVGFTIGAALLLALMIIVVAWRRAGGRIDLASPALGRSMVCGAMVCAAGVGYATWRHGSPLWEYVHGATRWTLTVDHGAVEVYRTPADPAMPYHRVSAGGNSGKGIVVTVKGRAGFYVRQSSWPAESWNLEAPVWAVVMGTGTGPVIWLGTRLRQRRRQIAGRCQQCGYDLRASVDRCPECGAAIVAESDSQNH